MMPWLTNSSFALALALNSTGNVRKARRKDDRAARGSESGTAGDTLLPMLIGGLVLIVAGVIVVLVVV
jgi:hypothetical protein